MELHYESVRINALAVMKKFVSGLIMEGSKPPLYALAELQSKAMTQGSGKVLKGGIHFDLWHCHDSCSFILKG